jgi:inner membrane protein
MASIGHVAIGLVIGRCMSGPCGRVARDMAVCTALSLLPDIDAVGFALGVPYGAPLGHRGATHSLLVALAVGAAAALAYRCPRDRSLTMIALVAVTASHGLLDTLTSGGLGVALLWPFSLTRYFAPWRPIPVAPIGLGLLSSRSLRPFAFELVAFAPAFAYALWPRKRVSRV